MLTGRKRHTPTARYVIFAALKPWTHLVLDSIPTEDTYITNTIYYVIPLCANLSPTRVVIAAARRWQPEVCIDPDFRKSTSEPE